MDSKSPLKFVSIITKGRKAADAEAGKEGQSVAPFAAEEEVSICRDLKHQVEQSIANVHLQLRAELRELVALASEAVSDSVLEHVGTSVDALEAENQALRDRLQALGDTGEILVATAVAPGGGAALEAAKKVRGLVEEGDGEEGDPNQHMTDRERMADLKGRLTAREMPDDASRLYRFVASSAFDHFFTALIMLNCLMMGLQAHIDLLDHKGPVLILRIFEYIFTSAFAVELCLRLKAFGPMKFFGFAEDVNQDGPFNVMDATLVVVTSFATFIMPLLSTSGNSSTLRIVSLLRALRLLRLIRVLRKTPWLRDVWVMLRGIADSLGILVWTVLVLAGITYIFAVVGVVLISTEIKDARDKSPDSTRLNNLMIYVNGLDLMMMTLVQVLTMDSWNGIVREMVPTVGWSWIYFYTYIAFADLVLMNLVTAIIVDNAISKSQNDQTQKIQEKMQQRDKELTELETIFLALDKDGNGTISKEEFHTSFDEPAMLQKWLMLDYHPSECLELFTLLDEGDGEVNREEFFGGLKKMNGEAQSKDLFRVQKQLEKVDRVLSNKHLKKGDAWHNLHDTLVDAAKCAHLHRPPGNTHHLYFGEGREAGTDGNDVLTPLAPAVEKLDPDVAPGTRDIPGFLDEWAQPAGAQQSGTPDPGISSFDGFSNSVASSQEHYTV